MQIYKGITLFFLFSLGITFGQGDTKSPTEFFSDFPKSDLFILGTFHFKDAGLDGYKPKHDIDILSEKRQGELEEVLDAIRKFKPTKIAIEAKKERQGRIDSLYQEYLAGRFKLKSNEIYQIGFRMAKELGHKKVYAVDVWGRRFDPDMTEEEYNEKEAYFVNKAEPSLLEREQALHNRFMEMYAEEDASKMNQSLLQSLLNENDLENARVSHGHYLIGNFKMNEGDNYFGADGAIWWYSRNSRIFANLLSINDPGKDKVFLLIGAGHLPILNFLAQSSPDFNQVHLKDLVEE